MIQPGTRIGPYTVEAEIGMGATAVVYRVRHSGLETLRALNVLPVSHPQLRDRMLRQGRMQATLQHPNIVRVLDTLDVDGSLGLLMEHVDGMNLDEWLRQRPAPGGPVLESLAEQDDPAMPWVAMVIASLSAVLGTLLVVSVVLVRWMSLLWRVP